VYQFSRAIYRELSPFIVEDEPGTCPGTNHGHVLRSCEAVVERLASDRHYFARPARTLFNDIRIYFPMGVQRRVLAVVGHYVAAADEFLLSQPRGFDLNGNPLQCRATTRKGAPCQRAPLPRNGYCPSHQHLAETEQAEQRRHAIAA
jgi:hypothetical protein